VSAGEVKSSRKMRILFALISFIFYEFHDRNSNLYCRFCIRFVSKTPSLILSIFLESIPSKHYFYLSDRYSVVNNKSRSLFPLQKLRFPFKDIKQDVSKF
jgi:hypothetical protein